MINKKFNYRELTLWAEMYFLQNESEPDYGQEKNLQKNTFKHVIVIIH